MFSLMFSSGEVGSINARLSIKKESAGYRLPARPVHTMVETQCAIFNTWRTARGNQAGD
jgi:hypothetical protein